MQVPLTNPPDISIFPQLGKLADFARLADTEVDYELRANTHEDIVGIVMETSGCVDLLEDTVLDHRRRIVRRHGLDLVVGDVEDGDTWIAPKTGQSRPSSLLATWYRVWRVLRPSGRPTAGGTIALPIATC